MKKLGGFDYSSLEISNRHKMNNKYIRKSIRVFPFGNDELTPEEKLFKNTFEEWYSAKHRTASNDEITFINSISIKNCPYCSSIKFIKDGHRKDGIQKYKCNDCSRSFTPLTNTIFDSRKIPISEWFEFLLHLFEFHSIKTSSYDNRNAESTGRYWLIKVFEVLKGIQDDVVLDGTIYLDEMYLPKIKSETVKKNGKKLRGISNNKLGVGVATNKDKSIFIVTGTSKPSVTSTLRTYGSHIKEGSTIIHDKEKSHNALVNKLNLVSITYSSKETVGLEDKENPLDPVNNLHNLAKRFIREHGSYDRDNLQDWMNLVWFILNPPNDKYSKVLKFIEIAISSPKRVKYRDSMMKNFTK